MILFGRMEVNECEFFPPRASDNFTFPLPDCTTKRYNEKKNKKKRHTTTLGSKESGKK